MIKFFKIIFSLILLTMLISCPPLGEPKITVHEKDIDPRWQQFNGGYQAENSPSGVVYTASISNGSAWIYITTIVIPIPVLIQIVDCSPEQFYQGPNPSSQTVWKINITFTNFSYTFYKTN